MRPEGATCPIGAADPRDDRGPVRVAIAPEIVGVQPAAKKLFMGRAQRANDRRIAVQRFAEDWRPDRTFGANGVATADIAPGVRVDSAPELRRVFAVPGGVIAFGVAFHSRPYGFAVKFDRAGRLDRRFADRGRLVIGSSAGMEDVYDLAATASGSLVALGSSDGKRSQRLRVARFTRGGRLDTGFGRGGRANAGVLRGRGVDVRRLSRSEYGGAIDTGPGGATVGVAFLRTGVLRSVVFRLNRDGSPDRHFGRRGVKRVDHLG